MSDQEQLLVRCFASVFPTLSEEEIQNATTESIGIWDSVSTVTLVAVIQEELNIEIDPEIIPELDSFQAFRNYLFGLSPVKL
jgi:acyl carrier protein